MITPWSAISSLKTFPFIPKAIENCVKFSFKRILLTTCHDSHTHISQGCSSFPKKKKQGNKNCVHDVSLFLPTSLTAKATEREQKFLEKWRQSPCGPYLLMCVVRKLTILSTIAKFLRKVCFWGVICKKNL